MKEVSIWYLCDNESGAAIARGIADLGLRVTVITDRDFSKANIVADVINLFVIDLKGPDLESIVGIMRRDRRLNGFLKLVILGKRQAKKAQQVAVNLLHVEYVTRPIAIREFSLLLEKIIVVEKYREIMRLVSKDSVERIEAYENLVNIGRRDVFETHKEKEVFERIIAYERRVLAEQKKLNDTLREVSLLRQAEIFDVRNRIRAEEMLGELRRHEISDAQKVIKAQEAVIDFSAQELKEAGKVLEATERVQELSRAEALRLHEEIETERRRRRELENEVRRLTRELARVTGP